MLRQLLSWLANHQDEAAALYLLIDDWNNAGTWSQRMAVVQRAVSILFEIISDFPLMQMNAARANAGFHGDNSDAALAAEFANSFEAAGIKGPRLAQFIKFLRESWDEILLFIVIFMSSKENFAARQAAASAAAASATASPTPAG